MKRRHFVAALAGIPAGMAAMAPSFARAETAEKWVIGLLSGVKAETFAKPVAAFRGGLKETGYQVGHNLAIEYRWAEGQYDRLRPLADDLVQRKVAAIFATGTIASAQIAKAETATIPIVFANGGDPVQDGLVASLSRPGGHVTGITFFNNVLTSKRLGLVRELFPSVSLVAVLINPNNARAKVDAKSIEDAARAAEQPIRIFHASDAAGIDAAFAATAQQHAGAVLVNSDAFFNQRRDQLATLAVRYRLPVIDPSREFAVAGGLISYGSSLADAYREAGVYVGRILNGAKPADLPVQQPTRFELVVNLRTAKALGIAIPPTLLARADEVIE